MKDKYIESHFDFRLNGNINGVESGKQSDFAFAMYRDELKGREGCNPDINIEQKDNQSNPHWQKISDANEKYLGLNGGSRNQTSFAKEWNNDYVLDLIGREYCRDRSIACSEKEFANLNGLATSQRSINNGTRKMDIKRFRTGRKNKDLVKILEIS